MCVGVLRDLSVSHICSDGKILSPRKMNNQFLGAFAKLRKAAISFVMFVRLSAWNKSAPTGRIINEI